MDAVFSALVSTEYGNPDMVHLNVFMSRLASNHPPMRIFLVGNWATAPVTLE